MAPNFDRIQNAVAFPTQTLNYLLEEQVYDYHEFYQANFGVYGFMRLTQDLQHKIHWLESLPYIWQPHNSCTIDPTGNLREVTDTITPTRATAMSSHCYDELFGSCFKHFLQWDGQGPLELNAQGTRLMQQMVTKILEAMVLGARLTLVAGQLYDYATLVTNNRFKDDTKVSIKDLFSQTLGTARGWIGTAKAKAAEPGHAQINAGGILNAADFDGKDYDGDIFDMADAIYDAATDDLMNLVDTGGVQSIGTLGSMPFWHFSTHIYKAVAKQWRKQCDDPLCLNPRLTLENVNWNGRVFKVYYLDGMPVVPCHEINMWDKYLTNSTHFAYLNIPRNINLGASFANIPNLQQPGMGVRIQMSLDNEDYGKTTTRSDSLFSTAIGNTEYMAGQIIELTPA